MTSLPQELQPSKALPGGFSWAASYMAADSQLIRQHPFATPSSSLYLALLLLLLLLVPLLLPPPPLSFRAYPSPCLTCSPPHVGTRCQVYGWGQRWHPAGLRQQETFLHSGGGKEGRRGEVRRGEDRREQDGTGLCRCLMPHASCRFPKESRSTICQKAQASGLR
eukprot:768547-Hanusia_phi.AAC.6